MKKMDGPRFDLVSFAAKAGDKDSGNDSFISFW